MMVLLMGAGLVFTIATRGVQFRRLAFSFREVLGKLFTREQGQGTVTPFQALAPLPSPSSKLLVASRTFVALMVKT